MTRIKKKKDKKDPLTENSAADDNDHDNKDKDKDKDMNGHGGDDHGDDKPEMKDGEKDHKKEGMNMHYQMINGACTQVDDPQPNLDMYSDSSCTKEGKQYWINKFIYIKFFIYINGNYR